MVTTQKPTDDIDCSLRKAERNTVTLRPFVRLIRRSSTVHSALKLLLAIELSHCLGLHSLITIWAGYSRNQLHDVPVAAVEGALRRRPVLALVFGSDRVDDESRRQVEAFGQLGLASAAPCSRGRPEENN